MTGDGLKLGINKSNGGTLKSAISISDINKAKLPSEQLLKSPEAFGVITRTPKILRLFERVKKVAESDVSVVFLGETGVGKDFLADLLHKLSLRRDKPFVEVQVGGLPQTLVENELFGHKKGAFTGADKDQAGHFEVADGGTLFLNEITGIPLETQVKLLNVLDSKQITRLGDTVPRKIDVRIICATNDDLKALVKNGKFRNDLYYRIAVEIIEIPPLRERRDDIPLLADHFLEKILEKIGAPENMKLNEKTLSALTEYGWEGNVRELKNAIEAAVLVGKDRGLDAIDRELKLILAKKMEKKSRVGEGTLLELTNGIAEFMQRERIPLNEGVNSLYKANITKALLKAGTTTGAAEILKVKEQTLRFWMDQLGLVAVREGRKIVDVIEKTDPKSAEASPSQAKDESEQQH